MEWWLVTIIMFAGLLTMLLVFRMPVAFSLGIMGAIGAYFWWGGMSSLQIWALTAFRTVGDFILLPIPMFILMAEIIIVTGISARAFGALEKLAGRTRGSLAHSTVVLTAIFGAVTGFSPASCAAIGPIAIPEMLERGYDKKLAVGVVGGGAALAILIPPSALMVLYGGLADVSIGQMFMAGIVPGLVSTVLFLGWVWFRGMVDPAGVPRGTDIVSLKERLTGIFHLLPLALIIFMVLGTIYLGITTPSESAAIGTLASLALAAGYRVLNWSTMRTVLLRTIQVNAMLFAIIFCARFFTQVLAYLQVPAILAGIITDLAVPGWIIIASMMLLVITMGCFMDPASIMAVTVPIFIPVVLALGFNPLWFGILFMINCELATLTPPVGLNLFVLMGIVPGEITITDIFKGCFPFLMLHALTMVIVAFVPELALWLPGTMMGR
ncbi:TRAP transporter large permease subunit [Chloroflexota bacterium]